MVLQWRVGRKRALLAAITQLSATLAAHHNVGRALRTASQPFMLSSAVRSVAICCMLMMKLAKLAVSLLW